MRQYQIDDLRVEDHEKLLKWLEGHYESGGLDGVFWVPLAPHLLTDEQLAHKACHPLCFSLVLNEQKLAGELLVRTKKKMTCTCMGYATEVQRNWLVHLIDAMLDELTIIN